MALSVIFAGAAIVAAEGVGLPFTAGIAAFTTTSSRCGIQNFLPTMLLLSILSRFLVATSIVKLARISGQVYLYFSMVMKEPLIELLTWLTRNVPSKSIIHSAPFAVVLER